MSGEPETGSSAGRTRHKYRKRKRRRKKYAREIGDVEKEKIYMVLFFVIASIALISLIGWAIWSLIQNILDNYA